MSDENKDFRMLAAISAEVHGKLMEMRVFVYTLSGVGIEVCKNLILMGPKEVVIFDKKLVAAADLGSNFFLKEEDIGKMTRAEACVESLQKLNPAVSIRIAQSTQPSQIASYFNCVVINDCYDRDYLTQLNKRCRQKKVGFIYCGNLGLYGYTFIDYGDEHSVFDSTGEEPILVHIDGILKEKQGIVYTYKKQKHLLSDGDYVRFREVKGMQQLNGEDKMFQIKVLSPDSFSIGDTSAFGNYISGGVATQVKMGSIVKFRALEESLRYPYAPGNNEMPICSWQKFGMPEKLHCILNGMMEFWKIHQRLPAILNLEEADQLIKITKNWVATKIDEQGKQFNVDNIDEETIKNVSMFAQAQISPCCSFWGGIITQELVKLTGKYTPIHQWLHHEFFDALPVASDVSRSYPKNRYADYFAIFGEQFMERISKLKTLLVGAGALGCQLIKLFSLMGMSTTKESRVVCTDDDNIEISNLNRQFLFRKEHIGFNKSEVACHKGRQMNPDIKIESVKLKISPDNTDYFDDQFWLNTDMIVNAVDNVQARKFIDDMCVWYQKPLFESGTLGTKCHSQIILPFKTLTYNDIQDPQETSIPSCTLKNFPYQIQHTIQWARDYFEGIYSIPSSELVQFYENPENFIEATIKQYRQNPTISLTKFQQIKKLFIVGEKKSYRECVDLAVKQFYEIFHNQIQSLIHTYPIDALNQEDGKEFWGGVKRFPQSLSLDFADSQHLQFIHAAANIYAFMFGLPHENNVQTVIQLAKQVKVDKFVPKKIKISLDQNKNEEEPIVTEDDRQTVKILKNQLLQLAKNRKNQPKVVQFEKDDPTNYHIQLMTGVSNLRARNYHIDEVNKFKVKLIAGKIIPALATTTAMVVGAVGIEIIKHLLNKPVQCFKNLTCNLALPLWIFNDVSPPIEKADTEFDTEMNGPIKVLPEKFTKWTTMKVSSPTTIQKLKQHYETSYNFEVSSILYGNITLYASYIPSDKEKMNCTIQQVISKKTNKQISKKSKLLKLEICGNMEDGTDCVLPYIKYHL